MKENDADREVHLAHSVCKALSVFFDRMERTGRYLSHAEAREQSDLLMSFIRGYEKLAVLNVTQKTTRFKMLPKLHMLAHMAEDLVSYRYNIKFHHCYKDEDLVGLLKRLAIAVAKPIMEYRILLRWQLRLASWYPGVGRR